MKRIAYRYRSFAMFALLCAAFGHRATAAPLHWYVAPDDDLDAWIASAEQTWGEGQLPVEVFAGDWPPPDDSPRPHAFFHGELPAGEVVLRDVEGERRAPVVLGGMTVAEARRAVLLLLHSIWHPLGVADGGWVPVEEQPPDEEPPPPVTEPPRPLATLEEPPAVIWLRAAVLVGPAFRPGLDSPAVAPALRMGGALDSPKRSRIRLLAELSADLSGLTHVGGRAVWVHRLSMVAMVEVWFGSGAWRFPVSVGGGGAMIWASRADGGGSTASGLLPALRIGAGISPPPLVPGVRLGFGVVLGLELQRGGEPIEIRASARPAPSTRDLMPLTLGLQARLDLGEGGRPWVR